VAKVVAIDVAEQLLWQKNQKGDVMTRDLKTRKWLITINNPQDKGFTHEYLREILGSFKSLEYWCMADEIGECETYHTHIYVAFSSAVRFSSMQRKFPKVHLDPCNGTSQQNRDYIFKEGKWEKDKKKETHLSDTREEYGQMPVERQGARNDLADLYDMIKDDMTDYEILEASPQYIFNIDKIERARQVVREKKFRSEFRDIKVTYIYGATKTGKTRSIMEGYGYENVHRITDYRNPWDSYRGQDVILMEEFRSGMKIGELLTYMDGYPVELPARYSNKVACFTKIYIVSNIELQHQYKNIQADEKETWLAFLRRIHLIKEYKQDGKITERDIIQEFWWDDYICGRLESKITYVEDNDYAGENKELQLEA